MLASLKIELIGNLKVGFCRAKVSVLSLSSEGIDKTSMRGLRDYVNANSVGSRGVYEWFFLKEDKAYHVSSPITWKRVDDYYCHVIDGRIVRFDGLEDVIAWLNDRSV